MKNIVKVVIADKVKEPKYSFDKSIKPGYDYELTIIYNGDKSLDDVFPSIDEINKEIERYYNYSEDQDVKASKLLDLFSMPFDDENKPSIEEKLHIDAKTFIDSIELYSFDADSNIWNEEEHYFESDEYLAKDKIVDITRDFINEHEELQDKSILVNDSFKINSDVDDIYDRYPDFDDIYVIPAGSLAPMNLKDIVMSIKRFVSSIKKMDLSPLENALIVYDFVREKPYKKEDENDSVAESRDIFKVLSGSSIVCAGYANLYMAILNALGIQCSILKLDGKNNGRGHARNIIKIDDEKYKIHGIFICDPTYDSRREDDNDHNWLYNYKYFLRKKDDFKGEESSLDDKNLKFLQDNSIENIDKIIEGYNNGSLDVEHLIDTLLPFFVSSYNTFDEHKLDLYMQHSKDIIKYYNEQLSMEDFFKALLTVRYFENKIDSDKYEYNIDKIHENYKDYSFMIDRNKIVNEYLESFRWSGPVLVGDSEICEGEIQDSINLNFKRIIDEKNLDLLIKDDQGLIKVVKSIRLYSKEDTHSKNGNNRS